MDKQVPDGEKIGNNDKSDSGNIHNGFCKVIASLIRQGHPAAWSYGWSFTEICLEEAIEAQRQYKRDVAHAINIAFSDQKTLNEFLNPPKKNKEAEKDDGLGEWKRLANTLNNLGKK